MEDIKHILDQRLDELDWMDDETRRAARDKVWCHLSTCLASHSHPMVLGPSSARLPCSSCSLQPTGHGYVD